MRLLWITAYPPWPASFGGSIRVLHLLEQAARRHRITLLSLGDPAIAIPEAVRSRCLGGVAVLPPDQGRRAAQLRALVLGRCSYQELHASAALERRVAELASDHDAVVVDSTQMGWIATPPGLPRIINLHNLEAELLERTVATTPGRLLRWYRGIDARRLRIEERRLVAAASLVWTCSERESEVVRRLAPGVQTATVANGVDPGQWPAGPRDAALPEVVFVASMNYAPNADAACWFVTEVWPRLRARMPGLRCGLVGGRPDHRVQSLAGAGVSVHPLVPSVLPFYQSARLSVVPLRSGGGTRIKILEAAAVGTPQVSTAIGAEGLDLASGEHLLLADDAPAFAEACLAVLTDPEAARERARRARAAVLAAYAWSASGDRLLASLEAR